MKSFTRAISSSCSFFAARSRSMRASRSTS
jgi:hypothetical protein